MNLKIINQNKYIIIFLLLIIGLYDNSFNYMGTLFSIVITCLELYKIRHNEFKNLLINAIIFLIISILTIIVINITENIFLLESLNIRIIIPILTIILMFSKIDFKYKDIITSSYIIMTVLTIINLKDLLLTITSLMVIIIYIWKYKLIQKWKFINIQSDNFLFINYFILTYIYLNNCLDLIRNIQHNEVHHFNYNALIPLLIINIVFLLISPLSNRKQKI